MEIIGGYPIHSVKMENNQEHWNLMKDFVEQDKFWKAEEGWESKTETTRKSEEVWSKAILPMQNDIFEKFFVFFDKFSPLNCQIGIESWGNRYGKGAHQELHDHGSSVFSYTYMLKTFDDECFRFAVSSRINYLNATFPKICEGYYDNKSNIFWRKFGMEGSIIPEQAEGTLIIFPSNLSHFVLPNKRDEYRVTISGNFYIEDEIDPLQR
mgnify:CR=1 FL=1